MLTSPPEIEFKPTPAFSGSKGRATIDDFDRRVVAALSDREIAEMDDEELIGTIQSSRLPFVDSVLFARLAQMDRPTLEKLVYLARRCCRNLGT